MTRQSPPDDASATVIRAYRPQDAAATLRVLTRAIDETGRAGYTAEQVRAWLGTPPELADWNEHRLQVRTFVAEVDGRVVGFTDLDRHGYIDRLFVSPDHGRAGLGTRLLAHVVDVAGREGVDTLTTHASRVARPVFERAGFVVVHAETVLRGGVGLDRYAMRRPVASATG